MKKLLLLALVLVTTVVLTACTDSVEFVLLGDEEIHLTTGQAYTESGFLARDNYEDISENVTYEGNVDATHAGDYTVTYTLDYNGKTQELTRYVYYREYGCEALPEANLTECNVYWSDYLHTVVKLRILYEGDTYHDAASNIFTNVEAMLSKYHKLSDKYANYDGVVNIKTINDDPTSTHTIQPELFDMIQFTLDHQDEVDNRFNMALGPVLQIWHDYREDCNSWNICDVPTQSELDAANQYTDPSDITLDADNLTITLKEGMSLDLGGMSKGYISGKIIEYLDSLDLAGYLLNNGESNISIGGTHPTRENGKFLLAITDPTFQTPYYATVFLGDGDQLVTSGDYQQYYTVGSDVYHHIINPYSLFPDRTMRCVSIITSEPGLADLYSTAIFTMSVEDGVAFVNGIDGLEGIWYTMDDTVVFSDNFEALYLDQLYLD